MKRFGIISAISLEMEHILNNMVIEEELKICGFLFYTGCINHVPIVLTTCSVGKVNAACCTQLLISNFDVNYIINTGIAGGIHHTLKVKDIVISSDITYFDVNNAQMKKYYPHQENFTSSIELVALSQKACEEVLPPDISFYVGRIATGDRFVSTQDDKQKIRDEFNPHCVEMEGGAIAHVAYLNQVPFVVIRAISDLADDGAKNTYDTFKEHAARQSANITLKILQQYYNSCFSRKDKVILNATQTF
ncbi:MAG: 5'-methylthioadenosine/adenosylhomocysteine nucleosidase [Cellulosilyticaceae bacterium]